MTAFVAALVLEAVALMSCADDTAFSVDQSDCQGVRIVRGGQQISLSRDTAWYVVGVDDERLFYCDPFKVEAFFNVLRDIQVMGLSSKAPDSDFDCAVELYSSRGKLLRQLRLSPVAGSAQMIGSVDGGKCYVVGVPGLNQNPIVNFSEKPGYWKDLSLLELSPYNVSMLRVSNYVDPRQSFCVETQGAGFVAYGASGDVLDVPQDNIREYLGKATGSYRAAQYMDSVPAGSDAVIYRVDVRNSLGIRDSLMFYKKYLDGGRPDFNMMYFRHGHECGTVKYFDFDNLLIDGDRLR